MSAAAGSSQTVEIEDTNTDFFAVTTALLGTSTPAITVTVQRINASYQLATLGTHLEVVILCRGCALLIADSVVVEKLTSLRLVECVMKGDTANLPLIVVRGELRLDNTTLAHCKRKAFAVSGRLFIRESVFAGNLDSIVTAAALGMTIVVQNSTFTNNSSPLGTVLFLSASAAQSNSTTTVSFSDCSFRGNIGLSGGSFLYLNVNPRLELTPSQLLESRSLRVQRCTFRSNPGLLVLATLKAVQVVFNNNTFSSLDIPFSVRLLDSAFTVANSVASDIQYFLISSYVGGLLTVSETFIDRIRVGPAVFIRNSAPFGSGLVQVLNLTIQRPSIAPSTFYTSSVYGLTAVMQVDGVKVANGTSLVGACGVYGFGAVVTRRLHLEKVTLSGSMFVFLAVVGSGTDLLLRNVTFTSGSLINVYLSTASLDRMDMEPDAAMFSIKPMPHCNVLAAFDSVVNFTNGRFVYPPVANFPAIYLWKSTLQASNLYLPVMYSLFANLFESSDIQLSNTTIDDYSSSTLFSLSYLCTARIENITTSRLRLTASIISALFHSSISLHHIVIPSAEMQSLVMCSKSRVNITDISIADMHADTLFWYIVASDVFVTDLKVVDSVFDLVQIRSGAIAFRRVSMQRVAVRRKFIVAVNASVELDQFTIEDIAAHTITPLCSAKKHSSILLRNAILREIRSLEQGLMLIEDSSLTLESSSIESFDSTFISAFRAQVTISHSNVQDGGLKQVDSSSKARVTAGFIDCVDCSVDIDESRFAELSGTNGGAVSLTSKRTSSLLTVHNSVFEGGFAEGDGGFINVEAASAVITASKFVRGSAARGGAISFICRSNCSLLLNSTLFLDNSAIEGGAVKWTLVRPAFIGITDSNNTAIYGDFEASVAVRTVLLNSNTSAMRGVPGVVVIEPILIGFVDAIGQLVATDNSSTAELTSKSIVGTNYLIAVNGIANFSAIIVRTVPGTIEPIDVVSTSINKTFPGSDGATTRFTYETRRCIMGEVSTSEGCYLCPKNTFSVDPQESECRECPRYATCPGGRFLLLKSGYWRLSESRSDVYLCFSQEACRGGQNSTCAEGYSSHLCLLCREGYYASGLTRCYECEQSYVWISRSGAIAAVTFLVWGYLAVKSSYIYQLRLADTTVASLRLLITFLQAQIPLLLIPIDLKPVLMGFHSVTEMFLSFGLSSLNIECLQHKGYISSALRPVYLKAVVATAFPLLLIALLSAIFAARKCLARVPDALQKWVSASLISLFILQPYVVKTALALVACKSIENSDSRLLADVSVRCWQAPHSLFAIGLFLPSAILYVLAFPLVIAWLSLSRTLGIFSRPLAFYRSGLKASCRHWEIVSISRKTLLSLILGLLGAVDNVLGILIALVSLYLFLEWSIRAAPYIHPAHNRIEAVQSLLGLASLGICFYFISRIAIPETVLTTISLSATILLLCLVFVTVIYVLADVCRAKQIHVESSVSVSDSYSGPQPSANPSYHEMMVAT